MNKKFIRAITLCLVLVLTFQMTGMLEIVAYAADTDDESVAEVPTEPMIVGEDIGRREETVKHYRMSDGSYVAVSYGAPVHYQDSEGLWQDINNIPIMATAGSGADVYRIANAENVADFAASLADGHLLTASCREMAVSMSLLDMGQAMALTGEAQAMVISEDLTETGFTFNRNVVAQTEGNNTTMMALATEEGVPDEDFIPESLRSSIIYADVYPGVDIRYTIWSYHIKEEIIVRTHQESYRYDFFLALEGLDARANADGSISLLNSEDAEIYFIPAPYMMDSSGEYSNQVSYELTEVDGGFVLTVDADAGWIENEERELPVSIDPTIYTSQLSPSNTATDDIYSTYVHPEYPTSSFYQSTQLYTGYNGNYLSSPYITYLHFNTIPQLPEGSILSEVCIRMYLNRYSHIGCDVTPVGVFPVEDSAPDGVSTYEWFKSITYNTKPNVNFSEIVDYANTSYSAAAAYLYWNITELANSWYSGDENRTIALAAVGSFDSSCHSWQNYQDSQYSYGPVMTVTYRNGYGLEDYYTYQSMGAGKAGTAYIADATGQLKVVTNLLGYASDVNPFSLNLVYNSDYFMGSSGDYLPPSEMGIDMSLGSGWTLDCLQTISVSDSGTNYLEHRDGDGTIHYYKRASSSSSNYYDEDGLRLYIASLGANSYRLDDSQGSYAMFRNNVLSEIKDADGNRIYINYTDKRVTTITQTNRDGAEIILASFTYNTDNTLASVTDAAGNVYALGYTDGKLTSIQKNSTITAQFGYSGYRVNRMTDYESGYALNFTYDSAGRISQYSESVGAASGASVNVSYPGQGQITYQVHNRSDNSELYYNYLFDSAGRTVNAYVTDGSQNILGASNAVYSLSNSTDKRTNRILRSAATGVVAQQMLCNTGFEAGDWTHSGTSVSTTNPRTGTKALTGNTDGAYAQRTSESLASGRTYTFSGYVSTEGMSFSGTGIYLKVTDSNGNVWTGEPVNYATSEEINGGWERLSVTFTSQTSGAHTVAICREGATGTFYADDFQLELGEAPSAYNMVENGNLLSGSDWTFGTGASVSSGTLNITSSPTVTDAIAYQDIPVNQPGSQTYVLAGWAKADAAPNSQSATVNAATDTFKQFCLRAILTYSDGTTETHSVPFEADVEQWQFVSYAVIPQSPAKTVASIRVVCGYEQNFGTAQFDNITLIQETAQAMNYDAEGNLLSVSTTGLGTDVTTYSVSNFPMQKVTAGYGTYYYSYGTSTNSYQLVSMSHGVLKEKYTTNSKGNLLATSLYNLMGDTNKSFETSTTYSSDGNRVTSVTNAAQNTVTYAYDTQDSIMLGLPTSVTTPDGTVTNTAYDAFNRVIQTSIADTASLRYNYSNGLLSTMVREDSAGTDQTYGFTCDAFGNRLSIRVGDRILASYEYDEDQRLKKQTDGNGDSVTYTYDILGRVKTATYSDGLVLTYAYTGEGNLYSVTAMENGVETKYLYNYDSLGRLIYSEQKDNGASVMRARQGYDNVSRLVYQAWQLGSDTYTENYTYNSSQDGSLNTFKTATGETLTMGYDALRRLSTVTGGIYRKTYTYRDINYYKTTTQVASLVYDLPTDLTYGYTYDSMGNIATYTDSSGTMTYTYDNQGQLLSATDGTTTYSYTYDTVGNILTGNGHTYTYGDTQGWEDLLTAVDGQAITYDAIGNPTSYYNGTRWTFTWEDGKELAAATDGTTNLSFAYDANGIRTTKTVGNVTHTYYYAGGKLLREVYGNNTLDFFYDATGNAYALKYNGTVYYYITNLQGDVMQIVNADGAAVATYSYDPYGNVLTATGDLAEVNPLRYRGYYYDHETGLYYLQSRYYDPEIGRFLNADTFASTGQGILGNNMFAYCLNNPVNMHDSDGGCSKFLGFLWKVDCGQSTCPTSKNYSERTPGFFEKFLTHMTRPRKEGNTFSAGFSGGYSGAGITAGESGVLSVDTSYNYAFQRTTSMGAASGAGGSAGLVMTYTNATNVHDLEGYSESSGCTLVALGGITIDYITFSPSSKPGTTCWGISVVISIGGEFECHTVENYTAPSNSWNPYLALRDFMYGE